MASLGSRLLALPAMRYVARSSSSGGGGVFGGAMRSGGGPSVSLPHQFAGGRQRAMLRAPGVGAPGVGAPGVGAPGVGAPGVATSPAFGLGASLRGVLQVRAASSSTSKGKNKKNKKDKGRSNRLKKNGAGMKGYVAHSRHGPAEGRGKNPINISADGATKPMREELDMVGLYTLHHVISQATHQ
jgi:hypothetical protein